MYTNSHDFLLTHPRYCCIVNSSTKQTNGKTKMMAPKKTTSKKLSKEYMDLKEKSLSLIAEISRTNFLMFRGEATQDQKDKVLSELVNVNSQLAEQFLTEVAENQGQTKMATKATYTEKTQGWDDEKTVYWFDVEGTENDGLYGVVQSGCDDDYITDDHGIQQSGDFNREMLEICVITDEMIAA